jgi:hypothetical protein
VLVGSPTPKNVVHSAMSRHPETFVRLKRGVWALASKHPELAQQAQQPPVFSNDGEV